MTSEPIRELLTALAEGRSAGRHIPKRAAAVLAAVDEGERIAAQQVSNAELIDIAELLLTAVAAGDVRQIEAVAVGVAAAPGVAARLLAAVGGFTLAFADVAGIDWHAELSMQRARMVVDDALG
jgi:hypothetical protein